MEIFNYQGEIESSKSHFNRALILQSYKQNLALEGISHSRDVVFLKKALEASGPDFDVGEGGTTLRFLAFRLSRKPGHWKLFGSERLLSRPQAEISRILKQLGVEIELSQKHLEIKTQGWKTTHDEIFVDLSESSQFASGLLLNAWDLPFNLSLQFSEKRVSDGYLDMTLQLLKQAGLKFEQKPNGLFIPSHQKIQVSRLKIEPDVSSAFVVAALAACSGYSRIRNFPRQSLQPDSVFVEILKMINIPIRFEAEDLVVEKAGEIAPIKTSLNSAPDLFPVLCVLLSKAQGESVIYDTPQLIFKESNRLSKMGELLTLMKVPHMIEASGIRIQGPALPHNEVFSFDTDHDHRLAFAAAVARSIGYSINIKHPEVVDKSFPGFWDLFKGRT